MLFARKGGILRQKHNQQETQEFLIELNEKLPVFC